MVQGIVCVNGDGSACGNSGAGEVEMEEAACSTGSKGSARRWLIDRLCDQVGL